MENLFSSQFWLDQTAAALKAWAILIPFVLAVFATYEIRRVKLEKKNHKLKSTLLDCIAQREAVEFRLRLASEENIGKTKAIADIRTQIDGLHIQSALKHHTEPL